MPKSKSRESIINGLVNNYGVTRADAESYFDHVMENPDELGQYVGARELDVYAQHPTWGDIRDPNNVPTMDAWQSHITGFEINRDIVDYARENGIISQEQAEEFDSQLETEMNSWGGISSLNPEDEGLQPGILGNVGSLALDETGLQSAMSTSGFQSKDYYAGLLDNPHVQAALDTIGYAEGTVKDGIDDPHSVGFGYNTIDSLEAHPNVSYSFNEESGRKNTTAAAGKSQWQPGTYNTWADRLGLEDFGRKNQDIATLAQADELGALGDILSGNLDGWVNKVNANDYTVWAGLPSSKAPQPHKSWDDVRSFYADALTREAHEQNALTRQAEPSLTSRRDVANSMLAAGIPNLGPQEALAPSLLAGDITRTWGEREGIVQSMPEQEAQPAAPQDDYSPLDAPVTNPHSNFGILGDFTAPGSYQRSSPGILAAEFNDQFEQTPSLAMPNDFGVTGQTPTTGYQPNAGMSLADQYASYGLGNTIDAIDIPGSGLTTNAAPSDSFTFNGQTVTEPGISSQVAPQGYDSFADDPDNGVSKDIHSATAPIGPASQDRQASSTRQRSGINTGRVLGSVVGGLTMGPIGGIIGGILGGQAQDKGILGGLADSISNGSLSGPFGGMTMPGSPIAGNYVQSSDFSNNPNTGVDPNTGWQSYTNPETGVTTITGGMSQFGETQPMVSDAGFGGKA